VLTSDAEHMWQVLLLLGAAAGARCSVVGLWDVHVLLFSTHPGSGCFADLTSDEVSSCPCLGLSCQLPELPGQRLVGCCCLRFHQTNGCCFALPLLCMTSFCCSERAEDIYRIVAHHLGVPLIEVGKGRDASQSQQVVTDIGLSVALEVTRCLCS
jgi:hypothetical protein